MHSSCVESKAINIKKIQGHKGKDKTWQNSASDSFNRFLQVSSILFSLLTCVSFPLETLSEDPSRTIETCFLLKNETDLSCLTLNPAQQDNLDICFHSCCNSAAWKRLSLTMLFRSHQHLDQAFGWSEKFRQWHNWRLCEGARRHRNAKCDRWNCPSIQKLEQGLRWCEQYLR